MARIERENFTALRRELEAWGIKRCAAIKESRHHRLVFEAAGREHRFVVGLTSGEYRAVKNMIRDLRAALRGLGLQRVAS